MGSIIKDYNILNHYFIHFLCFFLKLTNTKGSPLRSTIRRGEIRFNENSTIQRYLWFSSMVLSVLCCDTYSPDTPLDIKKALRNLFNIGVLLSY